MQSGAVIWLPEIGQAALNHIGPKVVPALEQELAAIIGTQAGPACMVATLAPGVVAACIPRKIDAATLGVGVQCDAARHQHLLVAR